MRNTHPMQPVTIDVGDLVTIAQGPWPFLAPGTTVPDDTPLGLVADVHVDSGAVRVEWIVPVDSEPHRWMNPAVLTQASDA